MLSQIALSNFYSLRDTAVIDMVASGSRVFKNASTAGNVFAENGVNLLKSIAIFGPNASGKTNILKAVGTCLRYIRESHIYTSLSQPLYEPFKFGDEEQPSVFEMEFAIDGEKYVYGFSIRGGRVEEEHLYAYPKRYKALVFKRENDAEGNTSYSFSKKFIRPKEIVANTSPYTLFLTQAALMNRQVAARIIDFIGNRFTVGLPEFKDDAFEALLQTRKDAVIEALQQADSDIVNYEFISTEGGAKKLVTYHKVNPAKPFDFNNEESAGTRRLLRLLAAFIDAANNGKILLIDELETSLHPELVSYAVKTFNDSPRAQLIFTTHDLDLLDTDILRPDQIYFTSKNYDDGASDVYSLADFTDYRDYRHMRRDYKQGRFEAIPILPIK